MRSLALFAVLALCAAAPAAAEDVPRPPALEVPVECAIGRLCVVQNYVDQDPGPGARDYTCGPLSYDGHEGIDIRVLGAPPRRAGVPVLAAAPGLVTVARDGVPDEPPPAAGSARPEPGNTVLIEHGNGWRSQYSHLRQGSVAVAKGERVAAGARLGLVGRSGTAEFAHLHFETRLRGRAIDPFAGRPAAGGCARAQAPLWSPAARAALAYRAGGPLAAGFALQAPSLTQVLDGARPEPRLRRDAPALVFWAAAWGLRAGDREIVRVLGPRGRTLVEESARLRRNEAQRLRYLAPRRPGTAFAPGRYRGEYRVVRESDGRAVTIVALERAVELR